MSTPEPEIYLLLELGLPGIYLLLEPGLPAIYLLLEPGQVYQGYPAPLKKN